MQLQCALASTQYFEHFGGHAARARESGITNAPDASTATSPSLLPGWGAELDWDYIRSRTVAEY